MRIWVALTEDDGEFIGASATEAGAWRLVDQAIAVDQAD
jgi:hypothetical protein